MYVTTDFEIPPLSPPRDGDHTAATANTDKDFDETLTLLGGPNVCFGPR
eukprot:COSAG05_NODE_12695_length_458_cov_0.869081_1_plen_48_part_10